MKHTLVAVFDNRNDAQQALDDLAASGFSRQSIRLSEGDTTGQSGVTSAGTTAGSTTARDLDDDGSIGSSIRNFFGDLFGTDRSEDYRMYSEAVSRGHYVLTLDADSEPEVERAADIVERYSPLDIDEHAQQWGVLGQGSRLDSGNAMRGTSSLSQQSGSLQGAQYQGGQGSQLQGTQLQGSQQFQDTSAQRVGEGQSIPVIQEELKVGKREVQRGGVRVYNRLVETPVNETVGLREEHVNVERHAVDRPVNPADLNAFKETTIELRETAEEAVVEKTARVVEEVVVDKQVTQRQEQISDTVRHTEVQVENLGADDDAYYRNHYTSNLAGSGKRYEDYQPAYSYGSSMARNDAYRGRRWEEIEPNLRSDWESRNTGSTWENMKAAIRHGWERMTS